VISRPLAKKSFEIMAPVGTAAFAKAELKEWMKP